MEDVESLNFTDGLVPRPQIQYYPSQPFPAWAPSVTVAVGMLAFLAASFYLRHRKVMKKREILMDYFHIIFQYGGVKRKRMVTALCNTNAITLRELGRSFMKSCESVTYSDNSCPFYLDDYPYRRPQPQSRRPLVKKHPFFRSRGMTITKSYRGPFLRCKTQSEDHPRQYPSSFQDMIMKFKARRHQMDKANDQSKNKQRNALAPQFEGCSMCTIHGDELDYTNCVEQEEESSSYNKQRRNAFVLQCDRQIPRFADANRDVSRHSLGYVVPDGFTPEHFPFSGKRNSEPWKNRHDQNSETSQNPGQQDAVFHVHGGLLSPSNVVCGSHGYIPNVDEHGSTLHPYRNSEPTILIHSPSSDTDTSQGWNDIRSKYTNGVVFLKRVPKAGGISGEFYYEDTNAPPLDRPTRASLSKVSYVPSGNMNEYYNCIPSPNKEKNNKDILVSKSTKRKNVLSVTSKNRSARLSLGNLAVSNFNQRIDMQSESLHEYEPDHTQDKRGSCSSVHQQRPSSKTTWTRLKNVFSGSRAVQNRRLPVKSSKSLPESESHNVKSRHESKRWKRFISVFTGFRSLPETKKLNTPANAPKISSSYPLGLNLVGGNCDNFHVVDLEAGSKTQTFDPTQSRLPESLRQSSLPTTTSCIVNERNFSKENSNTAHRRDHRRPTTLHFQSRPQSFPEESIYGHQNVKHVKTIFDITRELQNRNNQTNHTGQKYKHLISHVTPNSMHSPHFKNDFRSYSFEAGYPSSQGEYRFKQCPSFTDSNSRAATPGRLEGNDSRTEVPLYCRRIRSLSPLPEINFADSNKRGLDPLTFNSESVPNKSVYLTPLELGSGQKNDVHSGFNIREELTSFKQNIPQPVLVYKATTAPSQCIPSYPVKTCDKPSLVVENENKQVVTTDIMNSMDSVILKQNPVSSNTSNLFLQSKTVLDSRDKLPQTCFLTLEHRHVSCSTDSVYYDTVSALDTPSPCVPKDLIDFSGQSSFCEYSRRLEDQERVSLSDVCGTSEISGFSTKCNAVINHDILDTHVVSTANKSTSSTQHVSALSMPRTSSQVESSFNISLEPKDNAPSFATNTIQATHGEHSTSDILHQQLPKQPSLTVDYVSDTCVLSSINEIHSKQQRHQTESLPVPATKPYNNEHQNTSSDSSPVSSRPCTPTRRHSTPSPTPDRRLSSHSGHYSPDELYMANVARLPRFLQRANYNSVVRNCAIQNASVMAGGDKTGNPKENVP